MNSSFSVFGLATGIIQPHDPFTDRIIAAAKTACGGFHNGDILILAETAVRDLRGKRGPGSIRSPRPPHARELAEKIPHGPPDRGNRLKRE